MKKIFSFVLAVMMLCTTMAQAAASVGNGAAVGTAETVTARVSKMEILLDGESVTPSGYLIGNYTYFKLRDIAVLMQKKQSKFSVSYDHAAKSIALVRGETYAADGTELAPVGSADQKATASALAVLIDGQAVQMQAYLVGGFTYYKLRDIGQNLGFEVDYKNESKQGIIRTPGYVEPTPEPTPPDPDPQPTPEPEKPVEPEKPKPGANIDGKLTILLDVGHGGTDSGSSGVAPIDFVDNKGKAVKAGEKIYEKDLNLAVSLYLRDMLTESGANVIMTRETDKTVSWADRKKYIEDNAAQADLCFSLHHNAHNSKAKGFEVLAQIKYKQGGAGKELSKALEKHYATTGRTRRPTVFREGQNGDYYAILRYAHDVNMLAVISEFAFVDNAEDILGLLSDEGLRQEAKVIHDGIMEFYATNEY